MQDTDQKLVTLAEELIGKLFSKVDEPAGGAGYRVDHSLRVKAYLEKFLEEPELQSYNINKTALIVGGVLHDIGDIRRIRGNSIDYSLEIDHSKEGAQIVKSELSKLSFDAELIEKVTEIVLLHHNYDSEASIETKLVQDADSIDELGYLNFWQMFQYSNFKKRNLAATIEYWNSEGKERKEECVRHCHFDFTRKIAQSRLEKMDVLILEISKEVTLANNK